MTSLSLKDDAELTPLADFFNRGRALIDAKLHQLLPPEARKPVAVHSAIRWSVFAGGKRFRPLLLLAAGETLGARGQNIGNCLRARDDSHLFPDP